MTTTHTEKTSVLQRAVNSTKQSIMEKRANIALTEQDLEEQKGDLNRAIGRLEVYQMSLNQANHEQLQEQTKAEQPKKPKAE